METIIKITPSELNAGLINKIKSYIGNDDTIDVTISLKEPDSDYKKVLDKSISNAEARTGLITFTMEEFMDYDPS